MIPNPFEAIIERAKLEVKIELLTILEDAIEAKKRALDAALAAMK